MRKLIQPHIMCGIEDVAKYVLIPGNPRRVETIASFLDESHKVADYRGFVTYTGSSDGIGISICSTGIGCPSARAVLALSFGSLAQFLCFYVQLLSTLFDYASVSSNCSHGSAKCFNRKSHVKNLKYA